LSLPPADSSAGSHSTTATVNNAVAGRQYERACGRHPPQLPPDVETADPGHEHVDKDRMARPFVPERCSGPVPLPGAGPCDDGAVVADQGFCTGTCRPRV
jgi:hypothetical protein